MESDTLPVELLFMVCRHLDVKDLFTLATLNRYFAEIFRDQKFWNSTARRYGMLVDDCTVSKIKRLFTLQHQKLREKVPVTIPNTHPHHQQLLFDIVYKDQDALLLETFTHRTSKFATKILELAIELSRIRIMHALFTHYNISAQSSWILFAIRKKQLPALRYLVEKSNIPLISPERGCLLPSKYGRWDDAYENHFASTFVHYNRLLLREVLTCDDVSVVAYIKSKLNEALAQGAQENPELELFTRARRHTVGSGFGLNTY